MLTVPLTVLSIRCPPVVKTVTGAVHINYLCTLVFKTVRGAVNINY
jgi:hypothetical protein